MSFLAVIAASAIAFSACAPAGLATPVGKIEATVFIAFEVGSDGVAKNIRVIKSRVDQSDKKQFYENQAIASVKKWRFDASVERRKYERRFDFRLNAKPS